MPRTVKSKLSHNQHNKKIKVREKFGIKDPNSTREALIIYRMNNNTFQEDDITKEVSAFYGLGVLQNYSPNKRFKNNGG